MAVDISLSLFFTSLNQRTSLSGWSRHNHAGRIRGLFPQYTSTRQGWEIWRRSRGTPREMSAKCATFI